MSKPKERVNLDKLLDEITVQVPYNKSVEDREKEGYHTRERLARATTKEELWDAWTGLMDMRLLTRKLKPTTRKLLQVIGWYSPITQAGVNDVCQGRVNPKILAVSLMELEQQRLIRGKIHEAGYTVWSITKLGILRLERDYKPMKTRDLELEEKLFLTGRKK